MSKPRSSSWSFRITLPADDQIRTKHFIAQERAYYNAVVGGLAGPLRTMPQTLQSITGRLEELFGLAAAHAVNPVQVRPEKRHKAFASYAELIDSADMRTSLLFDIAAAEGTISHVVRRALATEALRYARDQSVAINAPELAESSYRFAIQSLSVLEPMQKRHVQMPRSTIKVVEEENSLVLKLPYHASTITVAKPPVAWNIAFLRDELDGSFTLELAQERESYNVRRVDQSGQRKRRGER